MTDFDIISFCGVGLISSYVTVAFVGAAQPEINEYGEEEYTIPGYIFLASATLIKWGIELVIRLFERRERAAFTTIEETPKEIAHEQDEEEFDPISVFELYV